MRMTTTMLIASTLTLGACTTEVVREVPATQAKPPATAPAPSDTKWDTYLADVDTNAYRGTWTNDELIEFGTLVCGALDAGNTMRQVAGIMEASAETDTDMQLFASVLVAAVNNLCPEYLAALNGYINS